MIHSKNHNPHTLHLANKIQSDLRINSPKKTDYTILNIFRNFARAQSAAQRAFTLIEVMFAVMIVGLVLIPLMSSETNIITRLSALSNQLQRMFALSYFLTDTRAKNSTAPIKEKKQTTLDDPRAQLSFEERKLEEKKFKKFPDLFVQKATATWEDGNTKRTDVMISFAFKPTEKREKK